jgi:hypothetical protein
VRKGRDDIVVLEAGTFSEAVASAHRDTSCRNHLLLVRSQEAPGPQAGSSWSVARKNATVPDVRAGQPAADPEAPALPAQAGGPGQQRSNNNRDGDILHARDPQPAPSALPATRRVHPAVTMSVMKNSPV